MNERYKKNQNTQFTRMKMRITKTVTQTSNEETNIRPSPTLRRIPKHK